MSETFRCTNPFAFGDAIYSGGVIVDESDPILTSHPAHFARVNTPITGTETATAGPDEARARAAATAADAEAQAAAKEKADALAKARAEAAKQKVADQKAAALKGKPNA